MQQELDAAGLAVPVQIIAVNQVGHESGTPMFTSNRDLPMVQETAALDVWDLWKVTYRDVVILDENNERLDAYNLTQNNLAVQANYDALKAMLVAAATP